jgi:cytochrome c
MLNLLLVAGTIALASAPAGAAAVTGNADAGKKVFMKCAVCHGIGDKKGAIGPSLNNVIGRQAGTLPEFKARYSKQIVAAGAAGLVWNEAEISNWVAGPAKKIPGTKMAFPGLKSPQEIADVVAYVKTFSGK